MCRSLFAADGPLGFEIPDGKMTGGASNLIEPIGTDLCHVASTMRFSIDGWMRIAEPLLARILERDSRREEQTSSSTSSPP